jgi:hypothetical protein
VIPLRACGGNVLLKKVAMDEHRAGLIIYGGGSPLVLQVGEVVGLGGRWTQDRPWFPPMPTPHRTPLDNGKWDPDWKPPDLTDRARPQPASFCASHEAWLTELEVGDLVVYVQARVYDHFVWEGHDVLIYPGNWLMGVITGTSLNASPELRRYEGEQFDDAPHHRAKNIRGAGVR